MSGSSSCNPSTTRQLNLPPHDKELTLSPLRQPTSRLRQIPLTALLSLSLANHFPKHYTPGRLEHTLFRALEQSGLDLKALKPTDLAPVDDFHVGELVSTKELASQMELLPNLHLLDIPAG